MKDIKILGSGCAKCKKLYEETEKAAKALQMPYTMEKVTDMREISSYSVMMTPALVVDGVVVVAGKIPTHEELMKLLTDSSGS